MPRKKSKKDVETGAGYESQNPFVGHQADAGESHGEQAQDTSLERGESMQDTPVPSNADPMDAHLMRDPDPNNPNAPDAGMRQADINDSAPRTGLGTDGEDFDDGTDHEDTDGMMGGEGSDTAGLSVEDEENRAQDGYGAGRVMHGVDIDASSDAGEFGNPRQPETSRRLSGNER